MEFLNKKVSGLFWVLISLFTLNFLRYYLVFFSLAAFVFFLLIKYLLRKINIEKVLLAHILLLFCIPLVIFFFKTFSWEIELFLEYVENPVIGFIRYIMTPIPFNTESAYSFLDIPALINWLTLPLVFIGFFFYAGKMLTNRGFPVILFIILWSFFAFFTELQGPRHRLIVIPFMILFMVEGIALYQKSLRKGYE